ncbi:unnamed protein product [Meganyctiphanes norvegica]|uniref:Uncharacterized protein n=1 Tax=Meganyctiphanes norvegica TaxID=48144 RepID=A0AAV2Q7H9_MEGNR
MRKPLDRLQVALRNIGKEAQFLKGTNSKGCMRGSQSRRTSSQDEIINPSSNLNRMSAKESQDNPHQHSENTRRGGETLRKASELIKDLKENKRQKRHRRRMNSNRMIGIRKVNGDQKITRGNESHYGKKGYPCGNALSE